MITRSPLDDPEQAAHAWARYRRLMRFMGAVTLTVIVFAMALLYHNNGFVSIHFYIATALGIGFAMLLMAALMGLVFLSSGTGHDESISDPLGAGQNQGPKSGARIKALRVPVSGGNPPPAGRRPDVPG